MPRRGRQNWNYYWGNWSESEQENAQTQQHRGGNAGGKGWGQSHVKCPGCKRWLWKAEGTSFCKYCGGSLEEGTTSAAGNVNVDSKNESVEAKAAHDLANAAKDDALAAELKAIIDKHDKDHPLAALVGKLLPKPPPQPQATTVEDRNAELKEVMGKLRSSESKEKQLNGAMATKKQAWEEAERKHTEEKKIIRKLEDDRQEISSRLDKLVAKGRAEEEAKEARSKAVPDDDGDDIMGLELLAQNTEKLEDLSVEQLAAKFDEARKVHEKAQAVAASAATAQQQAEDRACKLKLLAETYEKRKSAKAEAERLENERKAEARAQEENAAQRRRTDDAEGK